MPLAIKRKKEPKSVVLYEYTVQISTCRYIKGSITEDGYTTHTSDISFTVYRKGKTYSYRIATSDGPEVAIVGIAKNRKDAIELGDSIFRRTIQNRF